MEENKINKIKKEYQKFEYNLPEIEKLDEDFQIINKLKEGSLFLLRDIRILMMQTLSSFYNLLDTFRNPKNVRGFILSFTSSFKDEDFKEIGNICNEIEHLMIKDMKISVIYSEKDTAQYINDVYSVWQILKPKIMNMLEKGNLENNNKRQNNINYFS